jgi:flagellar biogenesis protein FliO
MAALVVVWAIGPLGGVAQTATQVGDSVPPADPWSSTEILAPRMDARPLRRSSGKNETAASSSATKGDSARSAGGTGWRTAAALGGVVGLILLLAWGYRAVANGSGRWPLAFRNRHPALIEVISRVALSPRQSLCLVRIGPRLVLLGVTPDAVRTLDIVQDADLAAQLAGQVAQRRPDSHSAEFARCLEREAGAAAPSGDGLAETTVPEGRRLADLRQRLAGTVARLRAVGAET